MSPQKVILTLLLFAGLATACSSLDTNISTKSYVLTTGFENGKLVYLGVGGEINGEINPVLHARPGQTLTVMLINGGEGEHVIEFPDLHAASKPVTQQGQTTMLTLIVPNEEVDLTYLDSIANHAEIGMKGILRVSEEDAVQVAQSKEVVSEAAMPQIEEMALAHDEFDWAKQTYFERCAGCHGTLRKGATGPALTPDFTQVKGTAVLSTIIFSGTSRGMPDWGKQGILTQDQTVLMAEFLQVEPPAPPELSLEQMKGSWKEFVGVSDRPEAPQTTRDWENYFIVTLRDAGQVVVIDGDNYEVVSTVNTGYAVHITRMSATGRYAYVIGRDGKLALVDLWMETPEKIAEVQLCYDARSVEVSKYKGDLGDFTDQYAIVGCYWPPHFVILDGQTMEPFKVISTRSYTFDTEEFHPEPRVAAILASHFAPEWIVNVKETGQVWLVNYTDPINPVIKMIEGELFLHDGGMDSTKRYFLVAANQSDRVAVIDLQAGNLEALVDTPALPHPGRGANWIDPEFGPVWSTPHLEEPVVTSIGTDPKDHPDQAWQAVRTTPLPGSGSLFIKTHPQSKWVWVDMALNSNQELSRTVCVIAKSAPEEVHRCWEVASYGRAVHMEYNKQGTEVWISVWGSADTPGQTGEIVIYDDETLEEITRIPDLITPTGKFNVYNTVHDVY